MQQLDLFFVFVSSVLNFIKTECSTVERSDLAALEFLMSKQPRGNVRVGAGNAVCSRASNIFVEVKKFQTRVKDVAEKTAAENSEVSLLFVGQ